MAVQSIGAGGPSAGLVATALCPMHGPVVQRSLSELLRQYRHAAHMPCARPCFIFREGHTSGALPDVQAATNLGKHGPCLVCPEGTARQTWLYKGCGYPGSALKCIGSRMPRL